MFLTIQIAHSLHATAALLIPSKFPRYKSRFNTQITFGVRGDTLTTTRTRTNTEIKHRIRSDIP